MRSRGQKASTITSDVEMGTKKMAAKPYLKPAIADHIGEYKNTIEQELK